MCGPLPSRDCMWSVSLCVLYTNAQWWLWCQRVWVWSKRCWVHLDMVLDMLHMKARFFTESLNGNTNNSCTYGDTPGLKKDHILTRITQDSSQALLVMTSCRESILSPVLNPKEQSWIWGWSQSLTPWLSHLLRTAGLPLPSKIMLHLQFCDTVPSGLILDL